MLSRPGRTADADRPGPPTRPVPLEAVLSSDIPCLLALLGFLIASCCFSVLRPRRVVESRRAVRYVLIAAFRRLLDGDWERDFLVVRPGERVVMSYDDDVVRAEPVA